MPLYICFIDYGKVFDCVSHRKLWDTMEQMGFPVHIIQLVANLYKEQESVVRTTNGDTNWLNSSVVVGETGHAFCNCDLHGV